MIKLYVLIFCLHLVFFLAVFDIYFRSPLLKGLKPVENNIQSGARRIVFLVGDGLRADTFFGLNNNASNAPFFRTKYDESPSFCHHSNWAYTKTLLEFLMTKIESGKAAWGVSHSRVPTESRPGHVALLAGIYEDPSAVFKGWKANPIAFDSILNRSRLSFSWGSPDIIPMFKDSGQEHIYYETYSGEEQDFSGKPNGSHSLNIWVYNKLELFIQEAQKNETLGDLIRQDKILFFLNFMGIDVSGHANKPHSNEYLSNVKGTDALVKKIENLFENFYNDGATTYIFTADHGMTAWGSHGAGSAVETETPFVAWGIGIQPVKCVYRMTKEDDFYSSGLDSRCRQDINQADAAVLMAVLLGVPIPTNSVGSLPVRYLNLSSEQAFEAYLLNARQLLEQFNKRHDDVINSLSSFFFVEFGLTISDQLKHLNLAKADMRNNNVQSAMKGMQNFIQLILKGINFYETYYQNYLLFLVLCSFFGLMACIFLELLVEHSKGKVSHRNQGFIHQLFIGILVTTSLVFLAQSLPLHYLLYNVIPIVLWWYAVLQACKLRHLLPTLFRKENLINIFLYLAGTEILVFSFYQRSALTIGMIALSFWPVRNKNFRYIPKVYSLCWGVTCWILALFPLLPTIKTSGLRTEYILLSGASWYYFGMIILFAKLFNIFRLPFKLVFFQVVLIIPTVWNVNTVVRSLESGEGLHGFNQFLSILLLVTYMGLLAFGPITVLGKFITVCFSLGVPFLLFCTAHEALFPLVLSINLATWIFLEHFIFAKRLNNYDGDFLSVKSNDIRKAFFYVFYIIFSFFAIGNIDTINSFDTNWVRCFVTVFSPFTMMILILIKTFIPFLLTSCAFRFIIVISGADTRTIFLISLFFCEVMGAQFLYLVTNKGSWLDIGKSLSHYVIIEAMILFLIILYEVATYLSIRPKDCWKLSRNIAQHVLPKWHGD